MPDDHRSYSLEMLEEWVSDALDSDATPQEIYECIINTVAKSVNYHRACLNHSSRLLSLLEDKVDITNPSESGESSENVVSFSDYWSGKVTDKQFPRALNRYGYEYTPADFKLDSPHLHNDE